jgi:hypothetical protein
MGAAGCVTAGAQTPLPLRFDYPRYIQPLRAYTTVSRTRASETFAAGGDRCLMRTRSACRAVGGNIFLCRHHSTKRRFVASIVARESKCIELLSTKLPHHSCRMPRRHSNAHQQYGYRCVHNKIGGKPCLIANYYTK